MADEVNPTAGDEFKELQEHAGDFKVAPAHGIAAMALSFALKYHDINTVQDGALYQQYKLEGKNMQGLRLGMVLETAMRIEAHLLASSDRIAGIIVEALAVEVGDEPDAPTAEGDASGNAQS